MLGQVSVTAGIRLRFSAKVSVRFSISVNGE